eukprot:365419-Chlamydomonas_euryale.AAC.5
MPQQDGLGPGRPRRGYGEQPACQEGMHLQQHMRVAHPVDSTAAGHEVPRRQAQMSNAASVLRTQRTAQLRGMKCLGGRHRCPTPPACCVLSGQHSCGA